MIGAGGKHAGFLSGFPPLSVPGLGEDSGRLIPLDEVEAIGGLATVDFTQAIDETYEEYVFKWFEVTPADSGARHLLSRVSITGGQTYEAGSIYHNIVNWQPSSGSGGTVTGAQTSMEVGHNLQGGGDRRAVGYMQLFQYPITGNNKIITGRCTVRSTDTNIAILNDFGHWVNNTTDRINAVRFLLSAGNFSSGIFRLYGVGK